jgi:dTDP-4-dehydrorhamnose reductase
VKKYLILGGSGLLGSKLMSYFNQSHGTHFTNKISGQFKTSFLDLAHMESFRILIERVKPDVVINSSGMANVDFCELFPEKCWELNSWRPFLISQECAARNIKYVHISTDHYLNLNNIKLKESDSVSTINQYSFSKFNAEQLISFSDTKALIVRSNFFHFNFSSPRTYLDLLVNNIRKHVFAYSFNDVFFTPISTLNLARYIEILVDLDFSGVINVCGSEVLSKFEFHAAVLKEIGAPVGFHLSTALESLKLTAARPNYMALDNDLLQNLTRTKIPSIYDMIKTELGYSN